MALPGSTVYNPATGVGGGAAGNGNTAGSSLPALADRVTTLEDTTISLASDVDTNQQDIVDINEKQGQQDVAIAGLDTRVTALENA